MVIRYKCRNYMNLFIRILHSYLNVAQHAVRFAVCRCSPSWGKDMQDGGTRCYEWPRLCRSRFVLLEAIFHGSASRSCAIPRGLCVGSEKVSAFRQQFCTLNLHVMFECRVCRKIGIKKWPYRKVSVNKIRISLVPDAHIDD